MWKCACQIRLFTTPNQQTDGWCYSASKRQFLRKFFRKVCLFYKALEKTRKNNCIAHEEDKLFRLPKCTDHFLLTTNFEGLLQILDSFCITYQQLGFH